MKVEGPSTFISASAILPYTLVRIAAGSTSFPPEVETAAFVFPAVGICESGAEKAGVPVTVVPLNFETYQRVRCVSVNGISVGQLVYVNGNGEVTDEITGGISAGQSLQPIPAGVTTLCTLAATGSGGFNRAEDYSTTDTGSYYGTRPANVESYLNTAAEFIAPKTVTRHVYAQELLGGEIAAPKSLLGGHLSSDFTPEIVAGATPSPTVWCAAVQDTSGASNHIMQTSVAPPQSIWVSPEHNMTLDMTYFFQPSVAQTITVKAEFIFSDGGASVETAERTVVTTPNNFQNLRLLDNGDTGADDTRFETEGSYTIKLTIDAESAYIEPLYIRGLILTYTGKIY